MGGGLESRGIYLAMESEGWARSESRAAAMEYALTCGGKDCEGRVIHEAVG